MGAHLNYLFITLSILLQGIAYSHIFTSDQISIEEPFKRASNAILEDLKPIFGVMEDCDLRIINMKNSEVIDNDPLNPILSLDLILLSSSDNDYCHLEVKTCQNIQIKYISDACDSNIELCYSLYKADNITCILDATDTESSDSSSEVPSPSSNENIHRVAEEASSYLSDFFDDPESCPLHVKNILSASEKKDHGIKYNLEIQVEVEADDKDCAYEFKSCNNVIVFQPFPHSCPNEEFCLLPLSMKNITCVPISENIV